MCVTSVPRRHPDSGSARSTLHTRSGSVTSEASEEGARKGGVTDLASHPLFRNNENFRVGFIVKEVLRGHLSDPSPVRERRDETRERSQDDWWVLPTVSRWVGRQGRRPVPTRLRVGHGVGPVPGPYGSVRPADRNYHDTTHPLDRGSPRHRVFCTKPKVVDLHSHRSFDGRSSSLVLYGDSWAFPPCTPPVSPLTCLRGVASGTSTLRGVCRRPEV